MESDNRLNLLFYGGLSIIILSMAGAVAFARMAYKQGEASVMDVSWRRVLHMEMFLPVQKDTLASEMPRDAYDIERYTVTKDHMTWYPCGKTQCAMHWHTREDRAKYVHNEWIQDHDLVTQGTRGDPLLWFPFVPFTSPGLYAERIGGREESLTVTFSTGSDNSYTYNPSEESEWAKYAVGQSYSLMINLLNEPKWSTLQLVDKR